MFLLFRYPDATSRGSISIILRCVSSFSSIVGKSLDNIPFDFFFWNSLMFPSPHFTKFSPTISSNSSLDLNCPEDLPQQIMGSLRHPRQSHALGHREELVDQSVLCSCIYNHHVRRLFAITVWCRARSHQILLTGCLLISHAVLQFHLLFKSLPLASNYLLRL